MASNEGQPLLLDALPNELLDNILSFLTPAIPELGETRPVAYDTLIPEEPWYQPTRHRAALRACCLVSKKFRAIAEQYLYHHAILLTERQFVCFLRTLASRHDDIAQWTKYFAVHLTLNDTEVYTKIFSHFKQIPAETLQTSTHDTLKDLIMFRHNKITSEWLRVAPECLLIAILTVLKKAETVLLQIPVSEIEEQPQYTTLLETFHHNKTKSLGYNLRKLLIQTDPEILAMIQDDIEMNGEPGVTAGAAGVYWPLLLHCPKLTTLEVTADDGNWCTSAQVPSAFCLTEGKCPCQLSRFKHVYLNDSYANPQTLADLLAHLPALETLYVDPKWSEDNEAWMDTPVARTLDESLLAHGKHLRRLDLGFRDCAEAVQSIGEDGYLTCLPQLLNLTQLHIQLGLLFPDAPGPPAYVGLGLHHGPTAGPPPPGNLATAPPLPPLSQRLPPNLTELTLEDWWWRPTNPNQLDHRLPDPDSELHELMRYYNSNHSAAHRRAIVSGLLRFAKEVRGGLMPKLRKVVFLVRSAERWTVPLAKPGPHSGLDMGPYRIPKEELMTNLSMPTEQAALLKEIHRKAEEHGGMTVPDKWKMLLVRLADRRDNAGAGPPTPGGRSPMPPSTPGNPANETYREAGFGMLDQMLDVDIDGLQMSLRGAMQQLAPEMTKNAMRFLHTGPMTLREHLAEVEGMFVRQGIEFEASEM